MYVVNKTVLLPLHIGRGVCVCIYIYIYIHTHTHTHTHTQDYKSKIVGDLSQR